MSNQNAHRRGKVIGLVGGIASGKSFVTKFFGERGARILIADEIAHEVLQRPDVVREIKRAFGNSVLLDKDASKLDRKKIASLVFGRTEEHSHNRKLLEAIVQTRVRSDLESNIARWRQEVAAQVERTHAGNPLENWLILDIPLLLERGWDKECDEILFVDTPVELRRQFAFQRGWSEKDLEMREATQMPLEEKRQHATMIVRNDGTIEDLKTELAALLLPR